MSESEFRHIGIDIQAGIVTLTFNRPEVRNALNQRMMEEIGAAVDASRKGAKRIVYRAPGASGGACLSLAPVITSRHKGVALSLSF